MIPRPSLTLALVASTLLTVSVAAQQQQPLSETLEVRLLEVDVVVTDAAGNPVHGLTAADFELRENGKPQSITNFSEFRESGPGPVAAEATSAPSPTVNRPAPRTIVLLLDAIQLRGGPRRDFFDQIRALVDRTVRHGDGAHVLTWREGAFRPVLELTTDRERIRAAITALEKTPALLPSRGISIDSREAYLRTISKVTEQTSHGLTKAAEPYDPNDLLAEKRLTAYEELAEMRAKTASMQRIVSSIGASQGRVAVVFATEQFSRIAGKRGFVGTRSAGGAPSFDESAFDTRELIASVVAAANANGVSFYAVRPSLPSTAGETRSGDDEQMLYEQLDTATPGSVGTEAITDQLLLQDDLDALRQLADGTGGTAAVGAAGVKKVVERISVDLGSYYSLGWRAQSDGADRERRIGVRARKPGLVVRTRTSLVEKSDRTRAEDLLTAQLYERGSAGDLDLDVDVETPGRDRKGRAPIVIELTIPVDQLKFVADQGELAARFTILTIAGAGIGETSKITRDTRRITAGGKSTKDGVVRYSLTVISDAKNGTVSVGVFDEGSGQVGIRTIQLADGTATVSTPPPSAVANAAWREAFDRAVTQRKPLVVFFRPKRCRRCDDLESRSLAHPAIQQRIPGVSFAVVSWPGSRRAPSVWPSEEPGVGLFDPAGALRAKWTGVPETMQLARIFDGAVESSRNFQLAADLTKSGGPRAGAVEHAIGLLKLGMEAEARTLLEETARSEDVLQSQRASVALAALDARAGRITEALEALSLVRAEASSPDVAAEASFHFAVLSRYNGADLEAADAFREAITLGGASSPVGRAAAAELARASGAIRLVPFTSPVISGTQTVRTIASSAAIAKVVFTLDGDAGTAVSQPPFSTALDFGRLPQPHRVRVTAYDAAGSEIGRDEMAVNAAGNAFWVRLTAPAEGRAAGDVATSMELRAPAGHFVRSVVLTWNDRPVSTFTGAPWRGVVGIPDEIGVLRAIATLDDGRIAEDAVLLNGTGYAERMDVQLVQLPMTITSGPTAAADVVVTEGEVRRTVESVVPGSAAPLTVGLVIDSSSSMHSHLDEVQEAVLRFFESALDASDQAFLISFDSAAKLVAPPTGDRARLREALLKLLPNGFTALHDAIVLGLMQMEGIEGRRALLVFTDGDDTSSRYSAADVVELSRRSNIPIYLIAPRLDGSSRDVTKAARASGGRVHEVSDPQKIGSIYDSIAEALRAQMLVTIRTSTATKPNEWREIRVRIAGRDLDVRAPAGYYAPR